MTSPTISLLPPSLPCSLPSSIPPGTTESDLEIKEMRVKMDKVKVSISTATKGMRESLEKAETNIANLIKEVSMLAISSPKEQKQILGEF